VQCSSCSVSNLVQLNKIQAGSSSWRHCSTPCASRSAILICQGASNLTQMRGWRRDGVCFGKGPNVDTHTHTHTHSPDYECEGRENLSLHKNMGHGFLTLSVPRRLAQYKSVPQAATTALVLQPYLYSPSAFMASSRANFTFTFTFRTRSQVKNCHSVPKTSLFSKHLYLGALQRCDIVHLAIQRIEWHTNARATLIVVTQQQVFTAYMNKHWSFLWLV
jgi:hypothetical protein